MTTSEDRIKSVVGWASVSYALGFLTILLHTSRLGFPIFQLIQPLYVWVGLPLCVPLYFFRGISNYFTKSKEALNTELATSISSLKTPLNEVDLENAVLLTSFIGSILTSTRYGKSYYEKKIRGPVIDSFTKTEMRQDAATKVAAWIRKAGATYRGIKSVYGYFQLLNEAIGIILLLWLYVWFIYPIIPQKVGGGAPQQVKLILKAEDAGDYVLKAGYSTPTNLAPANKAIEFDCQLLYTSTDDYYLRSITGALLSFRKDATLGIIWSKSRWTSKYKNDSGQQNTLNPVSPPLLQQPRPK
ncbi:MAG: hypothetical protein PHP95_15150 [Desulfuromonadaceae bacterium]|nr:hypothetical protein [Desulfuromonadaceae bacterium]MDD2849787.1 hypothetical protein [Desulfuromonadaceae bacterium]MDD4129357.1 hypothetical protein [Desulfuromonadaceae bacterium]